MLREGPASAIPSTEILGVRVDAITIPIALDVIEAWLRENRREYVCICTAYTVVECHRSAELKEIVNGAGLVTPDGMPLVWLSRASGHAHVDRVYGPDLTLAVMDRFRGPGHRHFFYGGGPGVAQELARRFQDRFPGIEVAGTMTPPYADLDVLTDDLTAGVINESGADIVWVGISSPKQDRWMAMMRSRLEAPVLIGVGAAFDFHTGRVPQAPRWMQARGLEWLFRLVREPRRLWRRYLVGNTVFVLALAARWARQKRRR